MSRVSLRRERSSRRASKLTCCSSSFSSQGGMITTWNKFCFTGGYYESEFAPRTRLDLFVSLRSSLISILFPSFPLQPNFDFLDRRRFGDFGLLFGLVSLAFPSSLEAAEGHELTAFFPLRFPFQWETSAEQGSSSLSRYFSTPSVTDPRVLFWSHSYGATLGEPLARCSSTRSNSNSR